MIDYKNKIILGTEYFRPPNPDINDFERDIENIKKTGLNLIRTWLYWKTVNPEENKWNFEIYDKLFKIAEKNKIKVLIQINAEVVPEYIVNKFSDCLYMNFKGEKVIPYPLPMVQIGGYPGINPDCEQGRKYIEEFLKQVVLHYKENQSLFGYDAWNEFMPFYGFGSVKEYLFHPETKKKYREYLRKKYRKIENYNYIYGGRDYKSFEEIPMPSDGVFIDMLDLYEFASQWISDYLKWKVSIIKKYDSIHPVCAHCAGGLDSLLKVPFDVFEISKNVDIWGTSCYEKNFWRASLQALTTRDSSNGKMWGFVEMTGGRTWHGPYGENLRTPEFIEQLVLLPLSYGGNFNLFWQWRHERFGDESPNFGLVNEDDSFNERTERISKLAEIINEFDNLNFDKPDTGILIDWRTFVFEEVSKTIPILTFELIGWFYALSKVGANFRILYGSQVSKNGIPENIKLVIAPILNVEREGIIEKLTEFVNKGGNLLAGPFLFTYDKYTYAYSQTPPVEMQKIFGSKRKEILYIDSPIIENVKNFYKVEGYKFLEVYEPFDCDIWFTSGILITGTKRKKGNSITYRIGTPAGSYIGDILNHDGNRKIETTGLINICKEILEEVGCYLSPFSVTGNVLLKTAKKGNNYFVFIHNPLESSQDICIHSEKEFLKASDIIEKVELKKFPENKFFIHLNPRESKVLKIYIE